MISVIGLGQAGSNIAEEASKLGYLAGAINFSQKDLDSVDVKHKLRLLGSEGVGKNRNQAISLFQDQWETALNFIKDNFSNSKLIIFAFSSSGGSGSGISPILLEVAMSTMPNTLFVAMTVVPEITETETSQINCLKTFEELSKLDVAVFPIDNQQTRNGHPNIGKSKLLEMTNKSAISLFSKLASYTEKTSKNGNFDEKDFLTVLDTKGIGTISEIDITNISEGINLTPVGVAEKVISSWSNSVFTPISSDIVSKAAIVFDGQESLMEYIRPELIFKDVSPDIFEGNYHERNGKIVSVLTGLSWSMKRLYDIEKSIKIMQEKAASSVSQSSYQTSGIATLNKTQKNTEKKSVLDILNKYKH